jgi:hypothetical protein
MSNNRSATGQRRFNSAIKCHSVKEVGGEDAFGQTQSIAALLVSEYRQCNCWRSDCDTTFNQLLVSDDERISPGISLLNDNIIRSHVLAELLDGRD